MVQEICCATTSGVGGSDVIAGAAFEGEGILIVLTLFTYSVVEASSCFVGQLPMAVRCLYYDGELKYVALTV